MAGEWAELPLGDVITLQRGFDLPSQNRKSGRVPIVSSSGISDYHSEIGVKGPGVVTGRYGTIGQVFLIKEDYWPLNTTLWVKDFHGNDPHFASYLLRTVDFQSCSDKSSVPGVNRNDLHRIPVLLPSLAEQKAIASVLGAFDDKIELNRRMNATLEAMARALFQSWFVDFDPVRAKLDGREPPGLDPATAVLFPEHFDQAGDMPRPTGWQPKAVYDCARFINGVAFRNVQFSSDGSGLPVVKIAELKNGISPQTKFTTAELVQRYKIRDGEILFSWSGSPDTSIDTFVWAGGDGWLNQHIFKVEFHQPEEKLFVYYLLKHLKPTFIEIARDKQTTGLGHVTAQDMKRLHVAFPTKPMLQAFQRAVQPLFERCFATLTESRTLATLRDTLLPKLLSGQLRVTEALTAA